MSKNKGWPGEKQRHAMASRGIPTTFGSYSSKTPYANRSKDNKLYNVAGYVNGIWRWGTAIKTNSGKWIFVRDNSSNPPVKLIPRHIKIYGSTGLNSKLVIRYDEQGNMMPSDGIRDWVGGIAEKFRKGIDRVRYGKEGAQVLAESRQVTKDTKKSEKEAKLIEKQANELNKAAELAEREELIETKRQIREGPKDTPEELKMGGRIGSLVDNLAKQSHKPTEEELTNLTDELLESPDADAIIVVAEEKEKLVTYTSELQRTVDLFEVEYDAKKEEYRIEERYLYDRLHNDIRFLRANLRESIERISMSGIKESKQRHKIEEMKIDADIKEREFKAIYNNVREQHKADLNFIERMKDGTEDVHDQVYKRLRNMTASGIRKP